MIAAYKELDLLSEYMDIYIQLLQHKVYGKLMPVQMPTFKHFKETYKDERYSMVNTPFADRVYYRDGKLHYSYHKGEKATVSGKLLAIRRYNSWIGCVYYPKLFSQQWEIVDDTALSLFCKNKGV